jgi:L-threonylcarbamoyladenylate synthase
MDQKILFKAISALKSGGVIVYPTDTLYGLGADIYNDKAVKKVFNIKNRPFDMPLSVAVSCIEDLEKIAFVDINAKKIIEKLFPGKLTLILKKKKTVSNLVTGGLENIAIRIPDNPIALGILSDFGPLTCTSANIHGKDTPTVINDICMQFKGADIDFYIDHGKLEGEPSTIVDLTVKKPIITREGAVNVDDFLDAIDNEQ